MLTKEQIDYLFEFCETKGVRYYDVQVELVDHLANGIEKELAEHPGSSSEKALDVVFASFGYRKFAPLVAEKRKAAKIYRRRLWWSIFRKQLIWPGTWVGWGIFLFIYRLLVIHDNQIVLHISLVLAMSALIVALNGGKRMEELEDRTGKFFLLTNRTELNFMIFCTYASIILFSSISQDYPGHLSFLIIGTLIFTFFLMCLANYRTLKRLEKQLEKDYPEIFTVA
jgi:hypothetical protein